MSTNIEHSYTYITEGLYSVYMVNQKNLIEKCEVCGNENVEGGSIIVNDLPVGACTDAVTDFYLNEAEYEDRCLNCMEAA